MNKCFGITVLILFCLKGFGVSPPSALEKLDIEFQREIIQILSEAEEMGLPVHMLECKVVEGLAKGKTGDEIVGALKFRLANMVEISSNPPEPGTDFLNALYNLEREPAGPKPDESGAEPLSSRGKKSDLEAALEKAEKRMEKSEKILEKKLEKRDEILEKKMEKKMEALEKAMEKGKSKK